MISESQSVNKKKIFITGAAGYVGAMLIDIFSQRSDVEAILGLDKEPLPEFIKNCSKLQYIQSNCADNNWQVEAESFSPDVVIHTAWQIREMYGQKEKQWHWNVDGSNNVFDFAFQTPSVKKLIHFSTVSSYAAYPTNKIDYFFTEEDPFRPSDYLYAEEKRIAENNLISRYKQAQASGREIQVFVVRPAAITGPRGRYMRVRFGLQAALSGQLRKGFIHRTISLMVSFVPATPKWLRQFIHEDDVAGIVTLLAFNSLPGQYEVFNICPPGDPVLAKDMAEAVHKKTIPVYPWMVRLAFFFFWHVSRGRVPTSKGGWKSYSYPIAVDGSKISKLFGYQYQYESKEAFTKIVGRYAHHVHTSPK